MMSETYRSQAGMTLVELLIAVSLGATLTAVLGMVALSTLRHSGNNRAHVLAASAMEETARRITNDGQAAQKTDLVPGGPPVSNVTLTWTDPVNGEFHRVVYSLSGNNLQRSESVNEGQPTVRTGPGQLTSMTFYQPANQFQLFKVSLTSVDEISRVNETREYYVTLRSRD